VLTFVLDGNASLPPAAPPFKVQPIADPDYRDDAALTAKGFDVFNKHCITCHGWQAIAGGVGPDLRGSAVPLSPQALDDVVRGGALIGNGMPKFGGITDPDMVALRQYIRSRAADLRAGRLWPKGGGGFVSYTHRD
jgi:quinohemoprotein ethanol dehydrogenase